VALLPRTVGMAKAKGALMLGQEFSARQAEQWGLVWSVVEDEEALRDGALALARRLVQKCDAAVLAAIKASLHEEVVGSLEDVLRREAQIQARLS
jgi:2-(1,2-epoxy-1,2-dihydrophenyl)acetyl-CoA isomerase